MLLTHWLLALTITASAADPVWVSGDSFAYRRLSQAHGLSDSTVFTVTQDDAGMIWLGTASGGVNVFDGYGFRSFANAGATNSLSHNDAGVVVADSRGRVWVGTWGAGLNRFAPESGGFERVNPNRPPVFIQALFEDSRGRLWVGSAASGLQRFDPATGAFQAFGQPGDPGHNRVWDIAETPDGRIWAATSAGILVISEGEVQSVAVDPHPRSLLADGENLWLGTIEHLKHYSTADGRIKIAAGDLPRINTLHAFGAGKILIGTFAGLYMFDPVFEALAGCRGRGDRAGSRSHRSHAHRIVATTSPGDHYAGPRPVPARRDRLRLDLPRGSGCLRRQACRQESRRTGGLRPTLGCTERKEQQVMQEREFDVIVWGATGFTGRLVCEYLLATYQPDQLRWAMAARSEDRLRMLGNELGAGDRSIPRFTADSHERASLDALVARTRVVLTTVGPYAKHGSELVAACAAAGTDYCDLSGEVPWMQEMLEANAGTAQRTGARIVHCCGFDSIPSDIGVMVLNEAARERTGEPCRAIRFRLKAAKGGASGGTVASMLNIVTEARSDKRIARILRDPYALCPPGMRDGPRQPYVSGAAWDPDLGAWTGPFVMALINTRVVHKSNALSDYAYGADFRYDEAVITGKGLAGRMKALGIAGGLGAFTVGAAFSPTRALMQKFLPAPGEGPSEAEREAGFFNIVMLGETADGSIMKEKVTGEADPGYGSTAKMIGEAAACLAKDLDREDPPGGVWTPATAMGPKLRERLENRAGVRFEMVA